jgi:2-keto-4-pentenoate hydratase/2-oxohepta-3-ene-1,7-dioic acid hydratase in catechol pathway
MKIVSYLDAAGAASLGVMSDHARFVSLHRVAPRLPRTLRSLLEMDGGLERARESIEAERPEPDGSIEDVTLLPVVPDPPAIWCVGVNYLEHRQETGRSETQHPTMFLRIAASQVGHREPIVRPKASDKLDYEGELAVVIGRPGRHIPESRALSHVAGYACYNDGSVRDYQRHTSQFGPGKNFEGTGAFGPWLVTADELPDPYAQALTTRLNGEIVQQASIGSMLFRIEQVLHYLSTAYTLRPGDVISTGTPGGVGSKRSPPRFLVPGDTVEVEVTGVGVLSNPVVAEEG